MKLSVIIPAYNERGTIEAVVRRVQAVNLSPIEKEIIVVDDGSRDGTTEILKQLSGIRRISHERNAGKGAAVTTGIQTATGDIVLIQDADLEYHPEDYRTVIQPIVDGACDAVKGSRFVLYKPKFFGKRRDRKSTRLNSSHGYISYAVFCLKKKITNERCQLRGVP